MLLQKTCGERWQKFLSKQVHLYLEVFGFQVLTFIAVFLVFSYFLHFFHQVNLTVRIRKAQQSEQPLFTNFETNAHAQNVICSSVMFLTNAHAQSVISTCLFLRSCYHCETMLRTGKFYKHFNVDQEKLSGSTNQGERCFTIQFGYFN